MRIPILLLTLVPLAALGAPANKFYWPSSNTGVSVCAYLDNAGKDWKCGSNRYSGHKGTDIALSTGNNVFAAEGGTVNHRADGCPVGYVGSSCGGGFGNHVSLFHGAGDETIYGHLGNGTGITALGAAVGCGARLGASGSSGSSSGPHLHFETRVNVTQSNYYSGAADDPFAGACSGPISFWAAQGTGYSSACGVGAASPQSATTCGCPAGTFALWNCNEAGTERVRCVGGQVQKEGCANGCEVKPLGTDDVCKPPPPCPAGLDATWRCTEGGAQRQRCTAGVVQTEACAFGCDAPASAEATCKPMPPQCPAAVGAAWSCDGDARQRCVGGAVERESCSDGCAVTGGEALCTAGCPAGVGPAWTCTADASARQRCDRGLTSTEACAQGCAGGSCAGTVTPGCAPGTYPEWTCAADGSALSRCWMGVVQSTACTRGCTPTAPGMDDACAKPIVAPGEVRGGCSASGGAPLLGWVLVALGGLRRARRHS